MITSTMSSGNKKMEQPSLRATVIKYVAFNFLSSSAFSTKIRWLHQVISSVKTSAQSKCMDFGAFLHISMRWQIMPQK